MNKSSKEQVGDELLLEDMPVEIIASMEQRDRWFQSVRASDGVQEFVVSDLQKWLAGTPVTVAFFGGSTQLHKEIEETVSIISENCNLPFDFGCDESTGKYRTWSEDDQEYSADIRVSFDKKGYWSLVGTDSINGLIGLPTSDRGGRPYQRSLNLGGFDTFRPPTWKGTTIHEFMHAIAFKHEHQNFNGPCENEFRWEDDQDYLPTKDVQGKFIPDEAGRRPGIYTFLSGFPNGWSKAKVDHNLRQLDESHDLTASEFDRESVMLYRFSELFYKSVPSPCAPIGNGQTLSAGDINGLKHLYPLPGNILDAALQRRESLKAVMSMATSSTSSIHALEAQKSLARQKIVVKIDVKKAEELTGAEIEGNEPPSADFDISMKADEVIKATGYRQKNAPENLADQ